VRCFNHTIQLSAKALLKPFYSAGLIETDGDTNCGIALQGTDSDDEEKDNDNPEMDDEDKEEEEDTLDALDDDEREDLIKNTEAVCTTLMKVCTDIYIYCFVLMSVAAIGSQILFRGCPFHHHCPSCMA